MRGWRTQERRSWTAEARERMRPGNGPRSLSPGPRASMVHAPLESLAVFGAPMRRSSSPGFLALVLAATVAAASLPARAQDAAPPAAAAQEEDKVVYNKKT